MKVTSEIVSIISLTKDNFEELAKTSNSIIDQNFKYNIEWLIIDGSNINGNLKNKALIKKLKLKKKSTINISHHNTKILNIKGIYPCMNYGLKIAKGNSIIFLNSGDKFYSSNSLDLMYERLKDLKLVNSFVFGQAKIIYSKSLSWKFPGSRLNNIKNWLKYFDPNHQTMLISKKLAKKSLFDENCSIISDGIWKRKIINYAEDFDYINEPVINFYLNGVSNMKPSMKIATNQIKNKEVTFIRKIIIILKLLIPKKIYYLYPFFQKYKSLFIDFIF